MSVRCPGSRVPIAVQSTTKLAARAVRSVEGIPGRLRIEHLAHLIHEPWHVAGRRRDVARAGDLQVVVRAIHARCVRKAGDSQAVEIENVVGREPEGPRLTDVRVDQREDPVGLPNAIVDLESGGRIGAAVFVDAPAAHGSARASSARPR
jgi:hypothetical protein